MVDESLTAYLTGALTETGLSEKVAGASPALVRMQSKRIIYANDLANGPPVAASNSGALATQPVSVFGSTASEKVLVEQEDRR